MHKILSINHEYYPNGNKSCTRATHPSEWWKTRKIYEEIIMELPRSKYHILHRMILSIIHATEMLERMCTHGGGVWGGQWQQMESSSVEASHEWVTWCLSLLGGMYFNVWHNVCCFDFIRRIFWPLFENQKPVLGHSQWPYSEKMSRMRKMKQIVGKSRVRRFSTIYGRILVSY